MYHSLHFFTFLIPLAAWLWFSYHRIRGKLYLKHVEHSLYFLGLYFCVHLQADVGFDGKFPFPFVNALYSLIAVLTMPFCHIYTSQSFGLKAPNEASWAMLRSSIFCTPIVLYDILNPSTNSSPTDEGLNQLQIALTPDLSFKIDFLSVLLIVQWAWFCFCTIKMHLSAKRLQLHTTRSGAILMSVQIIVFCVMVFSNLTFEQPFYSKGVAFLILLAQTVLMALWIIVVADISDKTIVRDSNNNPVQMGYDAITTLASALRYHIEHDKVYARQGIKMDDLARELGTNRSYLSAAVNRAYGCSFSEVLAKYRIEEAKRLLLESPEMRIGDVAEQSGFSSLSVFGKAFREATGLTAKEFRAQGKIE